ncbi:protein FAM221A-like isoform X1 [Lineus longissimus]|uniref:protein FAM221A-like isoform X1 n=1 Tax=Lineus longissimus TaxID=88925 RepID=UPI00315D257A
MHDNANTMDDTESHAECHFNCECDNSSLSDPNYAQLKFQRQKNRLYVSWYSPPTGIDCKLVGPETPCFCTHRYKQHKTDFETIPEACPILQPCKVHGCCCNSYSYVPLNGSQPIRCGCKHYSDEHSETNLMKCKKSGCKCAGFKSSYTCGCDEPAHRHEMVVETRQEREKRGRPVGQEGVPYQAMGGLSGFSSLAEGYMRMDPSGKALPSKAFLNQPITSEDHPFLRANLEEVDMVKRTQGVRISDREQQELKSKMRQPGESEMDFYERRYQERKQGL